MASLMDVDNPRVSDYQVRRDALAFALELMSYISDRGEQITSARIVDAAKTFHAFLANS